MLFRGDWYPARPSSEGSDTLQDLVLRGLIPRRILFCGVSDPAGKLRPSGTRQKSFESLPFSLKGHFSKIVCMHKLHYPRHIRSMLLEPPIWKTVFVPRGLIPWRTTFKFEYLREFEPEFEIVLGYESGAYMGSIHEKNQRPKSRATVPLMLRNLFAFSSFQILSTFVNSSNILRWNLALFYFTNKIFNRSYFSNNFQIEHSHLLTLFCTHGMSLCFCALVRKVLFGLFFSNK